MSGRLLSPCRAWSFLIVHLTSFECSGMAADGRLCNFYATVSDRPGGISKLTAILSELGASIKDIYHERAWLHTSVDQVQVKCVVELNGKKHAERVKDALIRKGYPIVWDSKQ